MKAEIKTTRPNIGNKKHRTVKIPSETRKAIIEAVEKYLKLGFNLTKSCDLAFVPRTTFVTWCKEDPKLRQSVQYWRHYTSVSARETIQTAVENKSIDDAKWWLERKDKKDFSTRSEIVEVEDDEELQEDKDFSDIDEIIKKNQE